MKTGNRIAVILVAVFCATTRIACAVSSGSDAVAARQAEPAVPAAGSTDVCAHLGELKLDEVEIVGVWSQPANAPVEGAHLPGMSGKPGEGPPISGLPAFCRVAGRIHPEPGSDIRFEVWMPAAGWDGRLNGVGTGGFAGSIDFMTLASALKAGEAAASTDTGHSGAADESAWAKGHPERVRDYGWRAIHPTTAAAKRLVAAFYGRSADRSYFVGCSNGGRQMWSSARRSAAVQFEKIATLFTTGTA